MFILLCLLSFFYENFTVLKTKNESNSSWVTFNSFLLIKHASHFELIFFSIKRFNKCTQTWIIWINSSLIKIKSALSEVSIYWTYSLVCHFDINTHIDQRCTTIEPNLLSSASRLKESALTTKIHFFLNKEKYTDIWSNFLTICKKIKCEL